MASPGNQNCANVSAHFHFLFFALGTRYPLKLPPSSGGILDPTQCIVPWVHEVGMSTACWIFLILYNGR